MKKILLLITLLSIGFIPFNVALSKLDVLVATSILPMVVYPLIKLGSLSAQQITQGFIRYAAGMGSLTGGIWQLGNLLLNSQNRTVKQGLLTGGLLAAAGYLLRYNDIKNIKELNLYKNNERYKKIYNSMVFLGDSLVSLGGIGFSTFIAEFIFKKEIPKMMFTALGFGLINTLWIGTTRQENIKPSVSSYYNTDDLERTLKEYNDKITGGEVIKITNWTTKTNYYNAQIEKVEKAYEEYIKSYKNYYTNNQSLWSYIFESYFTSPFCPSFKSMLQEENVGKIRELISLIISNGVKLKHSGNHLKNRMYYNFQAYI